MTAVHQFLPTLARRDAVGGHALRVQELLRDLGAESEIYAIDVGPEMRGRAHPYDRFRGGRGTTWLLYQASTGSRLADWLMERPEPLVVNYHNITPVEFFAGWEPAVAAELRLGRRQLAQLAGRTELVIADSAYNEAEVVALGYRRTAVAPILFDPAVFEHEVDEELLGRLREAKAAGGADLLFVGRLAPNKAQHDLVKALAAYRRAYDPRARLHLVGAASSHAYLETLRAYVHALGLDDAVNLAGSVPDAELAAYYEAADVFVSASEHEGFCVPLLEAMHHRVPVVAFSEAAVPETLGPAGVLLGSKEPTRMAAAVARVSGDPALREALADAGTVRLADFDLTRARSRFAVAVRELLDGATA
ncbi:MAG: glycosyltransferase [Acidimicrobiia bacterium]|nr:glycosyltransferase [Acidimicrobiia bacterium]